MRPRGQRGGCFGKEKKLCVHNCVSRPSSPTCWCIMAVTWHVSRYKIPLSTMFSKILQRFMGIFLNTTTCSLDKNIESDYCMRLYAKCSNGLKPPTIVGILRVLNCWVKRQILKPQASSLNRQILKPEPSNFEASSLKF